MAADNPSYDPSKMTFTVSDANQLNAAIANIDAIGDDGGTTGTAPANGLPAGAYIIQLAANITLGAAPPANYTALNADGSSGGTLMIDSGAGGPSTTVAGSSQLFALNLSSGVSVTIDGTNPAGGTFTLNGANTYNGFFVYNGTVAIQNLAIDDTVAQGGAGNGGGAGMGGGLFVAGTGNIDGSGNALVTGGDVTLANVSFSGNEAIGGAAGDAYRGGGGLDGGAGSGAFGGGGVGLSANADPKGGSGGAGIILGAASGGNQGGDLGGAFGGAGGNDEGGGGGGTDGGAPNDAGFGGGGGNGGYGGFGGGAEDSFGELGAPGPGFGGGSDGQNGQGLGADVFVQQGGVLTIAGGTLGAGTVSGGTGNAANLAYGTGIFIYGGETVTLAPAAGATLTVAGTIADLTSPSEDAPVTDDGDGALAIGSQGSTGTVTLEAANTYAGGTTVNSGTLELVLTSSAGTGPITFGAGAPTLQIDPALGDNSTFADPLDSFGKGDSLDLRGLVYAPGATATVTGSTLAVTSGGVTNNFTFSGDTNDAFVVTSDGHAGTLVTIPALMQDAALFGSYTTSTSSVGGQVYALYQTILGRAPDPVGFETQVAAVEAGASIQSIAQSLLTSPEYANDYGSTVAPNSGFINQLYEDGLHRPADPGGQQLFGDQLANGTSRAEVAVEIATSPESSNDLAPTFANGVFVPDASDSMVARLYYGLLDRTPDAAGLQAQEAAVDSGTTIGQVIQSFLGSAEYQGTTVGQDNLAYIQGLYQTALGRQGDAAGLQAYETGLDTGSLSRANVADDFLTSTEFQSDEAGQSNANYVNSVYEAALGRAADPNGSTYFQNMLNNGVSRSQVAEDIVGSSEFAANVTAPGQAEFVTALYEGALGRAPAASEVQGWQNVLNAGASLATVAASIVESPEAASHLAPKIEVGHYVT